MRLLHVIPLLALALGCSRLPVPETETGPVTVGFSMGGNTKVSADAATGLFRWEDSDAVSLWADGDAGQSLSGTEFRLSANNGSQAYFTATLPEPMEDGTYNYTCIYPAADGTAGKTASYSIPSTQKAGKEPCLLWGRSTGAALREIDTSGPIDSEEMPQMRVSSLLHYLRFFIPEGADILGEPVKAIKFTMPENIAGELSVDVNSAAVSLGDGTRTVRLEGLSLESREGEYALAAIVPPTHSYTDRDSIGITLYGTEKYASVTPLSLRGRDFKAGHITSVAMRANALHDFYKVRFTLNGNDLGEEVRKVTFTLSDGSSWPGNESDTFVWSKENGEAIAVGESIDLSFEEKDKYLSLNGKNIRVTYESENAAINSEFTLSINQSELTSSEPLRCPYLFAEDFTGASTGFNKNGDLNASGHNQDTIEGSDYGLPGWTGNQVAVIEGGGNKVMAIRHQNESVFLQGTYRGRLDSAPIATIKEGHSVKVKVTFRYTGYTKGKCTPQISYGYSENQSAQSGYYEGGSAAIKGGALIENIKGDKISTPTSGTPGNTDKSATFEINGCTSLTRLAWDCYGTKGRFTTTQEWVFIDDIKVQIIK